MDKFYVPTIKDIRAGTKAALQWSTEFTLLCLGDAWWALTKGKLYLRDNKEKIVGPYFVGPLAPWQRRMSLARLFILLFATFPIAGPIIIGLLYGLIYYATLVLG